MTSSDTGVLNLQNALERLGLPATATIEEVRLRFRTLAKTEHPDLYLTPAEKAMATRRFQYIAEAYSHLSYAASRLGSATEAQMGASDSSATTEPSTSFTGPAPRPSDFARGWDAIIEPMETRYPRLGIVFEIALWPSVFILLPALMLTFWMALLVQHSPKALHIVSVVGARWIPAAFAVWFGFGMKGIFGWTVFISGCLMILLEIVGQVVGWFEVRCSSARLSTRVKNAESRFDEALRRLVSG